METAKKFSKGGLACTTIEKVGTKFKVKIECESHQTKEATLNSAQFESLVLAIKEISK
jgi:hypothetical protein